jgi:uncharacterized protein YbbC (DUF1343 family)/CubicO group peptidase (beta-lactamase class C family)
MVRPGTSRWFARIGIAACGILLAAGTPPVCAGGTRIDAGVLEAVAEVARRNVDEGRIPGAVIVIGNHGGVIYRGAFGTRVPAPVREPMTLDTEFDLASLTKVVATTTAIMQLFEHGKLRLDDPAARYWPAFAAHGKGAITIRQLMTHYSGLRADLDTEANWSGYSRALRLIESERPIYSPGTRFLYSDINFEVLGELVRRVSGEPLDAYCRKFIFAPLAMNRTFFKPPASIESCIAPTAAGHADSGRGEANDPTACRMGGVAGHAGLFSDGGDLARFAEAMLNGGSLGGSARILAAESVAAMTAPDAATVAAGRPRGLGWDVGPPLASNRDELLQAGSYGHTGFTGTMLWIDPVSDLYAIVLTNRVYSKADGDAAPLRAEILELLSCAAGTVNQSEIVARRPELKSYYASDLTQPAPARHRVASGLDVIASERLAPLALRRVGLITNQTGIDSRGERNIDLFHRILGRKLVAIFTPEHGLHGDANGPVASSADPATGLPIYSLYGATVRPRSGMLKGIDALVFDLQDAGTRFFTYETTMAYAMEAAAKNGIDFYVLDRPDPIRADVVQGPMLDGGRESFTGYFPIPVRHGMTPGELAEMFNAEKRLGAKLHVVRMRGYERREWFDQTGLKWVNPSPNLRSMREMMLYPAIALVEGANLSVGRGTATPFEIVGAPWIDEYQLASYLNHRAIAAVTFEAADFTPASDVYRGRLCHGIRVLLKDPDALNAPELGLELASALDRLYPDQVKLAATVGTIGSQHVVAALVDGEDPAEIAREWNQGVARFRLLRAKYLLY